MYGFSMFFVGVVSAILLVHFTEAWRVRRSSLAALDRLERDYLTKRTKGR
jgi:hypothetical protein